MLGAVVTLLAAGCGGGGQPAVCDSSAQLQATVEEIRGLDLGSATAADARPLYEARLANEILTVQEDAEGAVAKKAAPSRRWFRPQSPRFARTRTPCGCRRRS